MAPTQMPSFEPLGLIFLYYWGGWICLVLGVYSYLSTQKWTLAVLSGECMWCQRYKSGLMGYKANPFTPILPLWPSSCSYVILP